MRWRTLNERTAGILFDGALAARVKALEWLGARAKSTYCAGAAHGQWCSRLATHPDPTGLPGNYCAQHVKPHSRNQNAYVSEMGVRVAHVLWSIRRGDFTDREAAIRAILAARDDQARGEAVALDSKLTSTPEGTYILRDPDSPTS